MNKKSYPFSELNLWLAKVEEIHILLPEKPSLDLVASGCSLSSSLKKGGKKTVLVCPEEVKVKFGQVYGVNEIRDKISERSFIISINYNLEDVEKVAWDDKEQKVNLIIQPKEEAPIIREDMVSFSSRGGKVSNIITLGFRSSQELQAGLSRLGQNSNLLEQIEVVNIGIGAEWERESFGQVKIIDSQASSFSEIIAALIEGLSLPIDESEASNLLLGLRAATNSFSAANLGADAFEAAAFCLRAGGKLTEAAPQGATVNFGKPKIYQGTQISEK